MSKNKIFSKEMLSSTHDFIEYAHSKNVTRDFPKIIEHYKKILNFLYPYAAYSAVWDVIRAVEDAKLLAEIQYDYYSHIHEIKGRMP